MADGVVLIGNGDIWVDYALLLEKRGFKVKILSTFGYKEEFSLKLPNCRHFQFPLLNRAVFKDSDFNPLSHDELSSLEKHVSIVNFLFDRLEVDARRPKIPWAERWYIAKKIFSFWLAELREASPLFVYFSDVPHILSDYICYLASKQLSIPTLIVQKIPSISRVKLLTEAHSPNRSLEEYVAASCGSSLSQQCLEAIRAKIAPKIYRGNEPHYMQEQIKNSNDGSPAGMIARLLKNPKEVLKTRSVERQHNSLVRFGSGATFSDQKDFHPNFEARYLRLYNFLEKKRLRRDYGRRVTIKDSSQFFDFDYVLLPLHAQPEASSLPIGGEFVDQLRIIEFISGALPKGWKLLVKEHPSQMMGPVKGRGTRWAGFYKAAGQYDGVELVDWRLDQFQLIERAQLVATISGAVGLEALLRGKNVAAFGNCWWQDLPNVYRVRTACDLRRAMTSSVKGEKEEIREVLNSLQKLSARFLPVTAPQKRVRMEYVEAGEIFRSYLKERRCRRSDVVA